MNIIFLIGKLRCVKQLQINCELEVNEDEE